MPPWKNKKSKLTERDSTTGSHPSGCRTFSPSAHHHTPHVTRIITDICSPTTSLQNKIQSLFFSFSIVYLHLSSCVLHTSDGSDRQRVPLTSTQCFCHIRTSSLTDVCTGVFLLSYHFYFLRKGFWFIFFFLILKYCSDVAAVSHKGRKSYLKMDLNP